MSYKTYITEALVCGSRTKNTADKSYLLFTRDAGMLFASAKSVREERSKQRYALQEFSYIRVTLIYGKTGWRVTGAESLGNVYAVQTTREARALVRNVVKLLRRLIQGEIPHTSVFDEVKTVLERSHEGQEVALEEVVTLRILHALGYIAPEPELEGLLNGSIDEAVLHKGETDGITLKGRIEAALKESHL